MKSTTKWKTGGLASLLLASTGMLVATNATAQESSDEIIVTATKRETSLQETPLAITALGGEALEDRGVQTAADLGMFVPGADFSTNGGSTSITVRGIGSDGLAQPKDDPSIAAHLDGVYLARPASLAALMYDIERVEILRGPQGTLYGRNATGGALNIITRRPTNQVEAALEATVGDYGALEGRALFNLPLGDTLAFRISAMAAAHDGYSRQLNPAFQDADDQSDTAVRATLAWDPTSNFSVDLRASLFESDGVGPNRTLVDTTSLIGYTDANGDVYGGTTGAIIVDRDALTPSPGDDPRAIYTSNEQSQLIQSDTYSLTMNWDLAEAWSLRSITGYTDFVQDKDGSARPFQPSAIDSTFDFRTTSEAWSQEFNLTFDNGGPLSFVAGAFYFDDDGQNFFDQIPTNPVFFVTVQSDQFSSTTSRAVFGEVNYDITEDLTFTVGARRTEDEKVGSSQTQVIIPFGPTLNVPLSGVQEFERDDYKVGLDWTITDDVFAYINYSTAYKSGGVNTGIPTNQFYLPEELGAWQFGIRTDWLDGRLRINADGYIYEYENPQITQVLGTSLETQNVDSAEVQGFEIAAEYRPTGALTFGASIAYAQSEYGAGTITDIIDLDAFGQNVFGEVEIGGNPLRFTPEWSANVSASYTMPLGSVGSLTARTDIDWQDESLARPHGLPVDVIDAYTLINASLKYESSEEHFYIEAFGRNVTDETVMSARFVNPLHLVEYRPPATWGVRIGARY